MEKLKFILKEPKYKYIIIAIIIICTIIGTIVYNQTQNNTEEEYNFENLEIENSIAEKVVKKEMIKVHVDGEVINPSVIEIEEGSRIIDAINLAGGLTEEANIRNINLAYVLEDAMKIHIPNINDEELVSEVEESSNKLMININTASVEELQKLDGIGSAMAQRIVNYRKENGKFNSIEDLKNISGIGDSKLEKIKNNIYVK